MEQTFRPTVEGQWEPIMKRVESLYAHLALGNGHEVDVCSFWVRYGALFVGIVEKGCQIFSTFVTANEVEEFMNIPSNQAGNISDWINTQLDFNYDIEGNYYRECCLK